MAAGLRAAVSESALLSDCTRIEYCSVDERVDPVGPQARPVVVAGDDYQHLRVAELALDEEVVPQGTLDAGLEVGHCSVYPSSCRHPHPRGGVGDGERRF